VAKLSDPGMHQDGDNSQDDDQDKQKAFGEIVGSNRSRLHFHSPVDGCRNTKRFSSTHQVGFETMSDCASAAVSEGRYRSRRLPPGAIVHSALPGDAKKMAASAAVIFDVSVRGSHSAWTAR
jgi:hypothetical protein